MSVITDAALTKSGGGGARQHPRSTDTVSDPFSNEFDVPDEIAEAEIGPLSSLVGLSHAIGGML